MDDLAFIRALRENPEDDALRLVYADWLDERNDARAEFLRLQHSLIGLRKSDKRIADIRRRLEEMRTRLNFAWLACVDRAERYTTFWRNALCRYPYYLVVGNPLQIVIGGQSRAIISPSRATGKGAICILSGFSTSKYT